MLTAALASDDQTVLLVVRESDRSADLSREIERRLLASSHRSLRSVHCHCHEGIATLRGRVTSFYLKQVAQTLVMGVAGIERVFNHIEVYGD